MLNRQDLVQILFQASRQASPDPDRSLPALLFLAATLIHGGGGDPHGAVVLARALSKDITLAQSILLEIKQADQVKRPRKGTSRRPK